MSEGAPDLPHGSRVRSIAYAAWLYGLVIVLGLGCLPLLLGPRSGVMWASRLWARLAIWGLEAIVGLRVEIRGLQHRPTGPALVAAKHQCMLDTIAPFIDLDDPCFVLKRELVSLPIYGWYALKSGMIAVDRSAGSKALRALSSAVEDRLREERQILIFPEGTRKIPGAAPDYKSGVAALYRDTGFACTPMATNSGLFWPAHGVVRRPGVAVFEFLEPIPAGLKRADFMRTLEARIETASNALMAEARERA